MLKFLFILLTIGPGIQSSFAQSGFAPSEPVMANDPQTEKILKSKRPKKMYLEIGGELRSYTYDEPEISVKHSGLMPGLWGNFLMKNSWATFGVDSFFVFSNSNKYDGSICEDDGVTVTCVPYETNKQTDIISKTNAWIYLPASDVLRFKTGLGYRYLSNSVPDPGFYLRTGSWLYIPLGVEILYNSDPVFKWKYELVYDHIISGGIKSNLSNVSASYNDVYMDQTGYGLNTNIQLRYRNRYLFSFFYETWKMDVSDVQYAAANAPFREPANTATSIGLRFGYDFY